MKKLLIGCMIIGLLFTAAEAKKNKIFDLKDQYFSGTLIKKGQEGYGVEQRYDVGKAIVTTNTKLFGASYMYGMFTVDIKESPKDWNVNIKKKNGTNDETTAIRLTSDSGESYYIIYCSYTGIDRKTNEYIGYIQVNDKTFKINLSEIRNEKLSASITSINNKVTFRINGSVLLRIEKKDFGNLEKVEVELNDNYKDDELLALDIYKVK